MMDYPFSKTNISSDFLNNQREKNDPDMIYIQDKYDTDFIWDGETIDEEKK